jgi:hypothetical protein
MDPEEFGLVFDHFTRSAFRLEARDVYDVPAERKAFMAFLNRGTRPRQSDSWLRLVSSSTASGKTMQRVRLFSMPQTDYTRFEFALYEDNVAAGEDVRVVDRASLDDAARDWSAQDFWLFDGETVALMCYDATGAFLNAERVDDVQSYRDSARFALGVSTNFSTFIAGGRQ